MRHTKIFLAALVFFSFQSAAYASSILYSPNYFSMEVPAGSSKTVFLTLTMTDSSYSSYFWVVNSVVEGNLPKGWLKATPDNFFVTPSWPSKTVALMVSPPAEAAGGVYSGRLLSKSMTVHGQVGHGDGVFMEIVVPLGCSGTPMIEDLSVTPNVLWPPDNSEREVVVTGRITMPEGCSMTSAGYSVDDEYGVYNSVGEVQMEVDGSFSAVVPVEASRWGDDKDGRRYEITLFAEYELGVATSEGLTVSVPHDMRGKKGGH